MQRSKRQLWAACAGAVLFAALTLAVPVRAQVTVDAYRDYFLYGRFGEVCTMCEVVVLCQASDDPPPEDAVPSGGDFTLYHLQTRTFWSQMSTIWEWVLFQLRAGRTRRARAYPAGARVSRNGRIVVPREIVEARLVLEPGVLEFGDRNIDRVTRAWSGADTDAAPGFCSRLPLWDALESIEANAPGAEQ